MDLINTKDGNRADAMEPLHKAAGEGHAGAMYELGNCYSMDGSGIVPDADNAEYWYKMAALLGYEEAKAKLKLRRHDRQM